MLSDGEGKGDGKIDGKKIEYRKKQQEINRYLREYQIKNREYQKGMPKPLSEREYKYESKERKKRKKNILIRGIRTVGRGRKEEETAGVLRMLSWNCAGIATARKTANYIGELDVVILQETWIEKGKEKYELKRMAKGFSLVAKVADRRNKKGRAKGRVLVGIRKGIKYKKIDEWKYGLEVSGLDIGKKGSINLLVTYTNEKIKEVIEELRGMVEE